MNAMQQSQGSNQLPSQTVVNLKDPNVSVISLRSRKVTEPALEKKKKKIVSVTHEPSVFIEDEKNMCHQFLSHKEYSKIKRLMRKKKRNNIWLYSER